MVLQTVLLNPWDVLRAHKTSNYACTGLEQEAEVFQRSMAAVNELESQFGALWTQCQRCQGSLHQVWRLPADRRRQTIIHFGKFRLDQQTVMTCPAIGCHKLCAATVF